LREINQEPHIEAANKAINIAKGWGTAGEKFIIDILI
jgi:hypothetical protein